MFFRSCHGVDIINICSLITPGENSHLLLSILVKHLDHKNVVKQPLLQINILNVTTQLAKSAKQQPSVAIIGALTDLVKHLRKFLQNQAEASGPMTSDKCSSDVQTSLEKCISQLSDKVVSNFEFRNPILCPRSITNFIDTTVKKIRKV